MKTHFNFFLILIAFTLIMNFTWAQDSSRKTPVQLKQSTSQSPKLETEGNDIFSGWLLPISKIITLLSVTVGIYVSLSQYRLKVKEEIRLSKSTQIESEVKLLKMFIEAFDIAECRKDIIISEKIIEKLFDRKIITDADFKDLNNLGDVMRKLNIATRTMPGGAASQIAAIASVGTLGVTYNVLREPALKGLQHLYDQKIAQPQIQEYIDKINALNAPAGPVAD